MNHTRLVTDFNYSIDLTAYVSKHCWRIAVIPSNNSEGNITFRDALEQYTRSNKYLKEIRCQKQLIGWDFHLLKSQIERIIRWTGYGGMINIVSADL